MQIQSCARAHIEQAKRLAGLKRNLMENWKQKGAASDLIGLGATCFQQLTEQDPVAITKRCEI
jgi:hypothetical protein